MERPIEIIEELSVASQARTLARAAETSEGQLLEEVDRWRHRDGCFEQALTRPGLGVIAEYKRRSPSKDAINERVGVVETVAAYEWGGAAAISVLTEETRFGGSLEHLKTARAVTDLPIIRKDFIIDTAQLLEAKAAGADAALLIVAALKDEKLTALKGYADDIGLDVLVEVHTAEELERAKEINPRIIGINNRDLRDRRLGTDTAVTGRLLSAAPEDTVLVTESGFAMTEESRDHLRHLHTRGVDAVLVGEAVMRADNPEHAVRFLRDET